MRWRRVSALVRRDLSVALGSRAVVLPALISPIILLVFLPAGVGLFARGADDESLGDLQALFDALPAGAVDGLSDDPSVLLPQLLLVYMLAPLVMLVPVILSAVIAADGIAGEKERGTLEGVLLTPLSDAEVAVAKLLAALVPAVVLGMVGSVLYATVANLVLAGGSGGWVLPTTEYVVMSLWTGPAFAALSLAAVSLVSVKVKTTQEAFQVGGVVVLPVVGLLIGQSAGVLLLSTTLLVVAGAITFAVAAVLVVISARNLSRTRLGAKLG